MMYCAKCGTQLPDDAGFCFKCGSSVKQAAADTSSKVGEAFAPPGATQLKCASCGAPISPKFGEMVITCEYCGSSITLGNEGWKNIQKHTMLPLKIAQREEVVSRVHDLMDRGFLRRHLQESSTLEEFTLSVIPYWVIPVSARTSIVAVDAMAEVGTLATTAALIGVMGGAMSNRRGGFGGGSMAEGVLLGTVLTGGMGGGGGGVPKKAYRLDQNYNYPVVALKALAVYQPHDYEFSLGERTLFDISKIPKGVKVLNGDVNEDAAKYQAKTLVDQLQSQKAHAQYHMIQQITTEEDVTEGELLHVPVWFGRYDHKGKKIVLVIDGNSGQAINSMGL